MNPLLTWLRILARVSILALMPIALVRFWSWMALGFYALGVAGCFALLLVEAMTHAEKKDKDERDARARKKAGAALPLLIVYLCAGFGEACGNLYVDGEMRACTDMCKPNVVREFISSTSTTSAKCVCNLPTLAPATGGDK